MPSISPYNTATEIRHNPKALGNGPTTPKSLDLTAPHQDSFRSQSGRPKFGTSPAPSPDKPGWSRRVKASCKGAWQGTFTYKNWKWDLGYVGIGFLATLPFAAAIPGAHIVMLPALYVGGRLLNGLARGAQGLWNPSLIESGKATY